MRHCENTYAQIYFGLDATYVNTVGLLLLPQIVYQMWTEAVYELHVTFQIVVMWQKHN